MHVLSSPPSHGPRTGPGPACPAGFRTILSSGAATLRCGTRVGCRLSTSPCRPATFNGSATRSHAVGRLEMMAGRGRRHNGWGWSPASVPGDTQGRQNHEMRYVPPFPRRLGFAGWFEQIIKIYILISHLGGVEVVNVHNCSVASPGGAETDEEVPVCRLVPATVRRADERRLNVE